MEFHPEGVRPPLARIVREQGHLPEPDVRWFSSRNISLVSYDGGTNWYDRAAALRAERNPLLRFVVLPLLALGSRGRRADASADPPIGGASDEDGGELGPEGPALAGSLLREARERSGRTLEECRTALRARPGQVEALERGDLSRFGGDNIYARGFLRSYARLLDVDPERVLELHGQDPAFGGPVRPPRAPLRVRRDPPAGLALLAGLGVLVAVAAVTFAVVPIQPETLRPLLPPLPSFGSAAASDLVPIEDLERELVALDASRTSRSRELAEARLEGEQRDVQFGVLYEDRAAEIEGLLVAGRIDEGLEPLRLAVMLGDLPASPQESRLDGLRRRAATSNTLLLRWFLERLEEPLRDAAAQSGAPVGTFEVWMADPSRVGDMEVLHDPGPIVTDALTDLELLLDGRSALEVFDEIRRVADRIESDGDRAAYRILARARLEAAADDLAIDPGQLERWLDDLAPVPSGTVAG